MNYLREKKLENINNKKGQNGITLIALVITIIVLLILAGVSIMMLTGDNSILRNATDAKEATDLAQIKETISLAYTAAISKDYTAGTSKTFAEIFQEELEKEYGEGKVTVTGDNDDYVVTIEDIGSFTVKDGKVEKSIDAKYVPSVSYIVGASADATTDINGEAQISKGDTAYIIATISLGEGSIDSVTPGEGLTLVSSDSGKYVYSITSDGDYSITVVTNKGKDYEQTVTKNINISGAYEVANVPGEWKVTSSSNTDNEWYAYTNTTSNTVSSVNKPELMGNMKAIKYTGETTGSKWANAMTSDGSMWVWIPRYAYKITSGYHTNTAGTIEIKFVDTNNKCLDGSNEVIETDPSKITYTEDSDGNQVQNQWLLHPAFSSDASNGGGFGEISGFWFAKFETSGSTTVGTGFKSVAATSSLRSVSIGDFYTYARQQLYGETGSVDSYDGYTSFGQSHIVKNSEWGAVAYLSKSVYGSNDTVVTQNSSNYTTGGNSTASIVYTTNANQSTTQNAYGVYDMRGTSWEYVASYVNNGHSNLTASSYGAGMNDSTNVATSTKYKTVYAQGSSDGQSANYEANKGMKGDAVWETSSTYSSSTGSWQSACAYFPYSLIPFFVRGGDYYDSYAGVFYFNDSSGFANGYSSCRLALVP